jgi:hypothetical protein
MGCGPDYLSLLTPPPPAEKASAREDQAGQASTGDGAGHAGNSVANSWTKLNRILIGIGRAWVDV